MGAPGLLPLTRETVAVQAAAKSANRMANEDLPQRFTVCSQSANFGMAHVTGRTKPEERQEPNAGSGLLDSNERH